jgi:hypothetical protein
MKKHDLFGLILAIVTGVSLLATMLVRAFLPNFILPSFDGMAILAVTLIALVLDSYIAKDGKRIYWFIPVCSALIFGVFPWVACFLPYIDAIKLGILGAVISTVATFVFDIIKNRLSVTPAAKIAPFISGFGIYLAAQCFTGII